MVVSRKQRQEEQAIKILQTVLGCSTEYYEPYEKNFRAKRQKDIYALKKFDLNTYYTPDLIITDNFSKALIEELMFIDINEPEGDMLKEEVIGIHQEIEKLNTELKPGEAGSVLLNKPNSSLSQWILSKLNKINDKYALNRDKKGNVSINTGLIFCMAEERDPKIHQNASFNLSHLQMLILLSEALYALSEGRCNFHDIESNYLNQFVSFEFSEQYKNISFIFFIGNETAENQSYFIINDHFLRESNNIVAQILKTKRIGNGNIFRSYQEDRSSIILDIQHAIITEDSMVFPYGNTQYMGNGLPNMPVLQKADMKKIEQEFQDALQKRNLRLKS